MIAVQHCLESRDFRPGEMTQIDFEHVTKDTYVVLLRLIGPNGPWDFAVSLYDGDGRCKSSTWTGPSFERAREMFEGYRVHELSMSNGPKSVPVTGDDRAEVAEIEAEYADYKGLPVPRAETPRAGVSFGGDPSWVPTRDGLRRVDEPAEWHRLLARRTLAGLEHYPVHSEDDVAISDVRSMLDAFDAVRAYYGIGEEPRRPTATAPLDRTHPWAEVVAAAVRFVDDPGEVHGARKPCRRCGRHAVGPADSEYCEEHLPDEQPNDGGPPFRLGDWDEAKIEPPPQPTAPSEALAAIVKRGRDHYAEAIAERDIVDAHFFKTLLDDLEKLHKHGPIVGAGRESAGPPLDRTHPWADLVATAVRCVDGSATVHDLVVAVRAMQDKAYGLVDPPAPCASDPEPGDEP